MTTDYDAVVADWPPLSAEQRNELAVLLRMAAKPRPPIDGKPHPRPPGPPRPLPPKPKGK